MDPNQITYFAETDARNKKVRFGIKAKDRLRHVYIVGKTGMGKSTLLENMAIQDIQNGNGMAFIDPHGGTADKLLDYVPEHRIKDVLYFAPFDLEYPVSFNVLEDIGTDKRHLVVNGLMSTFEKIWVDAWSARMAYILNNTLLALLEYPGSTLLGVNRMLADKDYRKKVVDNVKDPSVKSFWVEEFGKYTERFAAEATPAIQNKVGQFTSNPLVRNLIGQPQSSFDIRKFMDEKKILIINLSKGQVGEGNAKLIGSMLITKIYLAAMSRADKSESELAKLPNFYLYVDEFQSFANKSFADILSEARKYKLNLTITHQYIEQMEEEVRDAVFGNVGTMMAFRVGAFDAEVLEKEFSPTFLAADLVNLGFAQIYLKLMIDGVSSQPFSATTMAPIARPDITFKKEVVESSRKIYARPRAEVEKGIQDWHDEGTVRAQPAQNQNFNQGGGAEYKNKPAGFDRNYDNNGGGRSNFKQEPRFENRQSNTQNERSEFSNKSVQNQIQNREERIEPKPMFNNTESKNDANKLAFAKAAEDLKMKNNLQENRLPKEKPFIEPISLSTLKNDNKKNPTPQNLSSLKDALANVLSKPKTENKPEAVVEQKQEVKNNVENKVVEEKPAPKKDEPVEKNNTNLNQKNNEPKNNSHINLSSNNISNREVPEEVLREVLNMEDTNK